MGMLPLPCLLNVHPTGRGNSPKVTGHIFMPAILRLSGTRKPIREGRPTSKDTMHHDPVSLLSLPKTKMSQIAITNNQSIIL